MTDLANHEAAHAWAQRLRPANDSRVFVVDVKTLLDCDFSFGEDEVGKRLAFCVAAHLAGQRFAIENYKPS